MDNQPEKTDINEVGCGRGFDGIKICGMNKWLCPSCSATQFSQEPKVESRIDYAYEIYKRVDTVFLMARKKRRYTQEYVLSEVITISNYGTNSETVKKLDRLIQWIDDCE